MAASTPPQHSWVQAWRICTSSSTAVYLLTEGVNEFNVNSFTIIPSVTPLHGYYIHSLRLSYYIHSLNCYEWQPVYPHSIPGDFVQCKLTHSLSY